MKVLNDLQLVVSVILSAWGLIALIGGPFLFFRARKFFPERSEAVTPDALRKALDDWNVKIQDAQGAELGRLRLSIDGNHRELMGRLSESRQRADEAHEIGTNAQHKVDLLAERLNGMDRMVVEKLKHVEDSLIQLRQMRRGDPQ